MLLSPSKISELFRLPFVSAHSAGRVGMNWRLQRFPATRYTTTDRSRSLTDRDPPTNDIPLPHPPNANQQPSPTPGESTNLPPVGPGLDPTDDAISLANEGSDIEVEGIGGEVDSMSGTDKMEREKRDDVKSGWVE